jgi:hypothetical protein
LAGRTQRARTRDLVADCETCGAPSHLIQDAAAYAYILGLYLGD